MNKAKAISAKLLMSWESTRKVLGNVGDIWVLVTFQFWWHFSLSDIFALVTLLLSTVYCLLCTVVTFLNVWNNFGRFGTFFFNRFLFAFCCVGSVLFEEKVYNIIVCIFVVKFLLYNIYFGAIWSHLEPFGAI